MARMRINGNLLRVLRQRHGLGVGDVAKAIGSTEKELEHFEGEERANIGLSKLEKLADLYGVSVFDFNSQLSKIHFSELPDFRTDNLQPAKVGVTAWKRINRAKRYRSEIEAIIKDKPEIARNKQFKEFPKNQSIKIIARHMREILDVSWSYQISSDRKEQLFDILRWRIEKNGVNVIQESYPLTDSRGFCLISDVGGADVICVNTKYNSKSARVFTLIHELAHILIRRDGISDYTIEKNEIERKCNKIAAEAIFPKAEFIEFMDPFVKDKQLDVDSLRQLSKRLGVSQFFMAVRLTEVGLVHSNYVNEWKRTLSPIERDEYGRGNLDPLSSDSEEETAPQFFGGSAGARKITNIGLGISSLAVRSLNMEIRDAVDIYRAFNIKPDQIESLEKAVDKRVELALNRA